MLHISHLLVLFSINGGPTQFLIYFFILFHHLYFSESLFLRLFHVNFFHPLGSRLLLVAEFGVKQIFVVRRAGNSLNELVESGCVRHEDTCRWRITLEAGLRVQEYVMAQIFEPLEGLLRVWLIWVCPANHRKVIYQIFLVEWD